MKNTHSQKQATKHKISELKIKKNVETNIKNLLTQKHGK